MKTLKLKAMALFLCLVMALAGCSVVGQDKKEDEETTTEEETTTTETTADETVDSTVVEVNVQSELFTADPAEIIDGSTYDEVYQRCQDDGLLVLPISDLGSWGDGNITQGFIATSAGGASLEDLSSLLDGELPEGYEDLFEGDVSAFQDFLETGEIPEGYEDLFGDLDDFDFEDFDIDPDTIPSFSYYSEDGNGVTASLSIGAGTVVCLQFESYDDAVAFLNSEYGTVDVQETDNGCTFSGQSSESGLSVTVEGAITSDGLLYMTCNVM